MSSPPSGEGGIGGARVTVLADDLIWATRLAEDLRAAGATPVSCRSLDQLEAALTGDTPVADPVAAVIVDLTARAYDGVEAIQVAADAGRPVLAVGQHDDHALRRRALDAGAARVFAYRKLADDGAAMLGLWLASAGGPDIVRNADAGAGRPAGSATRSDRADAARPPDAHGTRPSIPPERYRERLTAARTLTEEGGIAALLVGVGADLRYLTGYDALPLERLTMLVVPAAGRPTLVAPRLEALPARGSAAAAAGLVDVAVWDETDDPVAIVAALVRGAVGLSREPVRVAVSDRLWATFVLAIGAALPEAELGLASAVLRRLRTVKDADEVALLRLAAEAADRVVAAIAAGPLVGRTEADVAREVRERLVAEGHDLAEFAIVASGPDSASPHHGASERVIQAGEPIVLDIGGPLAGYGSDITRTIWVTGGDAAKGPDEEFLRIHALVRDAQAEATRAVRAGVSCERVDAVARGIIAAGGYGERFIHRLGHGIGLEGHEDPYLVADNAEVLEIGMAFSIEPGIYLEGRYGCRIEDIVVCGADGPIVLNQASRELLVVAG